jgi:hypothetical protein
MYQTKFKMGALRKKAFEAQVIKPVSWHTRMLYSCTYVCVCKGKDAFLYQTEVEIGTSGIDKLEARVCEHLSLHAHMYISMYAYIKTKRFSCTYVHQIHICACIHA